MSHPTFDLEDAVGTIRSWLAEADRLLITAGAGLSAAPAPVCSSWSSVPDSTLPA
ncbi:hypothetical protein [Streptomyces sp. NPDC052036]|uniref:hypothetical protein n=1 Tax=unclassified Streptomyces TaxID=2593676 RepID=UPI00341D0B02